MMKQSTLFTKKQKGEDGAVLGARVEPREPSTLFPLLREAKWRELLAPEFDKPYLRSLESAVEKEFVSKTKIFPPRELVFNALNTTPLEAVRVVILGQDPYHGAGQAMGLSFSIPRGVAVPSSLRNIYKELKEEIPDWTLPKHGDLSAWAQRGVLLLNTGLTVREAEAGSHSKLGWNSLTDRIVQIVSEQPQPVVFLLWGKHAQDRAKCIRANPRHLVLKSAHPSGLSASRGFFGNKHFIQTVEHLAKEEPEKPFDWSLPQ